MTTSGGTVLIVDDERTLARAVKAFLAEAGYEAEVADDGERALALVQTLRPDVVFTDVRLARYERNRPPSPDPRVRSRHSSDHHDRVWHHRRCR